MSTRFKSIIAILLVSSAIFMVSVQPANAYTSFFEVTVTESLATITTVVLSLSDDIGIMADRILVMADNIGIMADRIVHTEQMLADITTEGVTCK